MDRVRVTATLGPRAPRSGWQHVARRISVRAVVALVAFSSLTVVSSFPPYASARQLAPHHATAGRASTPARDTQPDLKGESAWFQLSHFGRQLPAPQARTKAFQQASALPV